MSFEELERLTNVRANTFAYTEQDSEQILFPPIAMGSPTDTWEAQCEVMHDLQKKETRAFLHGSTLSQYWRNKRIPRGLRIKKIPTLGREDPDFCVKWCDILNRCSLDLMLLVIENQNKRMTSIKQEIAELDTQLKKDFSAEQYKELVEKCDAQLEIYKTEMQRYKMDKYRRDTMDYRNNAVYSWLRQGPGQGLPGRPKSRPRKTTNQTTSSSDFSTDTDSSLTTSRFLRSAQGPLPSPNYAPGAQRGKRGGGKSARGRT